MRRQFLSILKAKQKTSRVLVDRIPHVAEFDLNIRRGPEHCKLNVYKNIRTKIVKIVQCWWLRNKGVIILILNLTLCAPLVTCAENFPVWSYPNRSSFTLHSLVCSKHFGFSPVHTQFLSFSRIVTLLLANSSCKFFTGQL